MMRSNESYLPPYLSICIWIWFTSLRKIILLINHLVTFLIIMLLSILIFDIRSRSNSVGHLATLVILWHWIPMPCMILKAKSCLTSLLIVPHCHLALTSLRRICHLMFLFFNAVMLPPLMIVGPLISFMQQSQKRFTLVVFDLYPRKYWWPLIQRFKTKSIKLASRGQTGVLLKPSTNGWVPYGPIFADLFAFSLDFEDI